MSDEYNWSAYEVLGTWTALAGAALGGIVKWLKNQRQSILGQVAALRESHERHVAAMQLAHHENANRFVKLEAHVTNTQDRLDELVEMSKDMNKKQDRQMEILLNLKQGRR